MSYSFEHFIPYFFGLKFAVIYFSYFLKYLMEWQTFCSFCCFIRKFGYEILGHFFKHSKVLTLVLLNPDILAFANSVDPDQLASEEANWSGSALFVIHYVNLYQNPESSNLIGWKLEMDMAFLFYWICTVCRSLCEFVSESRIK